MTGLMDGKVISKAVRSRVLPQLLPPDPDRDHDHDNEENGDDGECSGSTPVHLRLLRKCRVTNRLILVNALSVGWATLYCQAGEPLPRPAASLRETEQRLGVSVQDLVNIRLRQSEPPDRGEGLLVGLVILQHRVIAAGQQMVGAEGLVGAGERRRRPVGPRCRSRSVSR